MTLSAIRTTHGRYSLLELDNPSHVLSELGLDLHLEPNQVVAQEVTEALIKALSPEVSGVVLDPGIGLSQILSKAQSTGLLLRLEKVADETDPLSLPEFDPDFGVEEIANNYGVVKLELYYHPQEELAMAKRQWLAEMKDYCEYQKVELVLKHRLFAPHGETVSKDDFQDDQLTAVQELQGMCDLIALDSPPNSLAAATITAELDIPWIVHSGVQPYGLFKEAVREALENGAQGYMAGESIFQEIFGMRRKDTGVEMSKVHDFISTIARDRAIELSRIVGEQPGF